MGECLLGRQSAVRAVPGEGQDSGRSRDLQSTRLGSSACTCTLAAFPTLSCWESSVHMPATLAERVVHLQLFHWIVVQHADGITRRGLRVS